jgi:hypothetical protein
MQVDPTGDGGAWASERCLHGRGHSAPHGVKRIGRRLGKLTVSEDRRFYTDELDKCHNYRPNPFTNRAKAASAKPRAKMAFTVG